MKVALVNDFLPNTGIGNYAFSLFEELRKRIDVEMVYLDSRNELKEHKAGIQRLSGIKFPLLNQVLNNAIVFPAKIPVGFDVYHASNQYISNLVVGKKASVVSCMDIISKRLSPDYNPAVGFFWNSSLKRMKKAKKIIAISHFTKREIVKQLGIPGKKIEVIPLAFDEKKFVPMQKKESRRLLDLPESAEIILNVGSEEKRKNIQTLLKAFFEIAKQREDAVLLRVGEQRQETTRLAKKLGIFEKIKYLNNLSRENLALAYNAADALAFCSYYEGFGLPVLEAMACGCPVVAASASSVPEIAGKAALLVENPLDAKAFSDCIERVLASRALAKSLERKGFARARGFSWKKNAEATIKVYEGVLR